MTVVLVSIAAYLISSYPTITSFTIKDGNLTKITENINASEPNLITGNTIRTNDQKNVKEDIEAKELEGQILTEPNAKFNASVEVVA